MVSGCTARLIVGMRVPQCAEIIRMAEGLGSCSPSFRHAAPVSPGSSGSVGAPCETNRTGIFMWQILNLFTTEHTKHVGAGHAREPLIRGHGPLLQTHYDFFIHLD